MAVHVKILKIMLCSNCLMSRFFMHLSLKVQRTALIFWDFKMEVLISFFNERFYSLNHMIDQCKVTLMSVLV